MGVGIALTLACGPGWFDENEFLSYFQPESSNARPPDRLYFFSPQLYNLEAEQRSETSDSISRNENLRAWAAYAGGKVALATVAEAVYKGDDRPTNPFVVQLRRTHAAALDYLALARTTEKASAGGDVWSPIPADTVQLSRQLAETQNRYRTAPDGFLKERYGFQAVKLADQLGQSVQCQALYDQLIVPLPQKTFISDWALCRQAGAVLATGDTARAIYAFAQVFDRCPSRRRQAEASLRIHGIRFREEALRYARNNQEKAAVYAICALQPMQDALPLLKKIVALSPQNPLIELIMAREINRNEYYFLATANPVYGYDEASRRDSLAFERRRQTATSYADQLKAFAEESATTLGNPAFWYTAAAYVAYLGKNYESAQELLTKADQAPTTNPTLKQQRTVQQMLLLAAQDQEITPEVEARLIGYLESFRRPANFRLTNAFVTVCQQFAQTYQRGNPKAKSAGWLSGCSRRGETTDPENTAKAFLLTMLTTAQLTQGEPVQVNTDQLFVEDTASAATVERVVTFAEKPNPTDFDKRLLRLTGFGTDYLYTLLGRRLMAEQRYAAAATAFARVGPKTWRQEPFVSYFAENPLELTPTEQKPGGKNPYTPVDFARTLDQLQKQATTLRGDPAAQVYYQLGCAAFNLSWYGNAWVLVRRSWSSAEPAYSSWYAINRPADDRKTERQLQQEPYYTTAIAKAYFEKALTNAHNPELAAKACFMAARCEQNELRNRLILEERKPGYTQLDEKEVKALTRKLRQEQYDHYFAKLATDYRQTRFQAEIMAECATYADFLAHR
ncbi:hypothetical protein GCM10028773_14410 [Spirosoma koreense]